MGGQLQSPQGQLRAWSQTNLPAVTQLGSGEGSDPESPGSRVQTLGPTLGQNQVSKCIWEPGHMSMMKADKCWECPVKGQDKCWSVRKAG